ncbi:28 kDa heat- and acid-stable phosphoprotein-like [Patiria miniata]|uniref:Casein kinase substrate phosphoprotein PP28 domain-containing protein n=1 Tax=Patiria miniata TaxID=46514 RepID=A0A913ZC37_PATMI|nr:28 kDa heat- and acid-stable phosphoprotein-like [Patiria miniata]XP_038064392.1 28 kDa heat- and acid-stable phosphoprotein-like [Patiria miniata]
MPRGGRKGGHKGRSRKFNNPEEIDDQMRAHEWREPAKEGSGDEGTAKQPAKTISDTDSDSDSDEDQGHKGVSHLIAIENPNRVANKMKKASQVDVNESGTAALSRRERKEIEKEEATQRYLKLHREGKTPEAQADLARLAIIRKEREEAAKKREQEKKAKEEAKAAARKK